MTTQEEQLIRLISELNTPLVIKARCLECQELKTITNLLFVYREHGRLNDLELLCKECAIRFRKENMRTLEDLK